MHAEATNKTGGKGMENTKIIIIACFGTRALCPPRPTEQGWCHESS
jgi:hypothetical protein